MLEAWEGLCGILVVPLGVWQTMALAPAQTNSRWDAAGSCGPVGLLLAGQGMLKVTVTLCLFLSGR